MITERRAASQTSLDLDGLVSYNSPPVDFIDLDLALANWGVRFFVARRFFHVGFGAQTERVRAGMIIPDMT